MHVTCVVCVDNEKLDGVGTDTEVTAVDEATRKSELTGRPARPQPPVCLH